MPNIPANLLTELRLSSALRNEDEVTRFEDALAEVAALDDPDAIPELTELLDDSSDRPEVMFSIVHLIEDFEFGEYFSRLLPVLPRLSQRAPYWATVLHTRILNSPQARGIYAEEARRADPAAREAARAMLRSIRERKPKFADACDEVLTHAV